MNKLAEVLIRFRYHKYVVTCDISNMFLRVRVPKEDQKFLRFFFRNREGELKVVQMCSHAFGLTQSPYVVINTVKTIAEANSQTLPLAAKAVLRDSIVDDILTGCKTYESLVTLKGRNRNLVWQIANASPQMGDKFSFVAQIDLSRNYRQVQ